MILLTNLSLFKFILSYPFVNILYIMLTIGRIYPNHLYIANFVCIYDDL